MVRVDEAAPPGLAPPVRAPSPLAPVAAALAVVLLWASAFVGIRSAGAHIAPGGLALGRLAVGTVALAGFAIPRWTGLPARRDLGSIAACGVAWFAAYNVALNTAERHVDSGTAAMLVNVGPLLIILGGILLLGERATPRFGLGVAVAFAGVILIGLSTSQSAHADVAGVVLCLVAAVAYAAGVLLQKPVLARVAPLQLTFLACIVGTIACLPFAGQLVRGVRDAPAGAVAWMVFLGVFPTAVAFTLWAWALARTGSGRLAVLTYLVPPVAVLLGWAWLDEVPAGLALVGGGLCLAGVVVGRLPASARFRSRSGSIRLPDST